MNTLSRKGFTLIELLIVIVIIGILSGLVIAVINPQRQITRSNQTVFRTHVEKGCFATFACASSTQDATMCDDLATEVGFATPATPTPATYTLDDGGGGAIAATDPIRFTGSYDGCVYRCQITPSSGVVTTQFQKDATSTANCIIN